MIVSRYECLLMPLNQKAYVLLLASSSKTTVSTRENFKKATFRQKIFTKSGSICQKKGFTSFGGVEWKGNLNYSTVTRKNDSTMKISDGQLLRSK